MILGCGWDSISSVLRFTSPWIVTMHSHMISSGQWAVSRGVILPDQSIWELVPDLLTICSSRIANKVVSFCLQSWLQTTRFKKPSSLSHHLVHSCPKMKMINYNPWVKSSSPPCYVNKSFRCWYCLLTFWIHAYSFMYHLSCFHAAVADLRGE